MAHCALFLLSTLLIPFISAVPQSDGSPQDGGVCTDTNFGYAQQPYPGEIFYIPPSATCTFGEVFQVGPPATCALVTNTVYLVGPGGPYPTTVVTASENTPYSVALGTAAAGLMQPGEYSAMNTISGHQVWATFTITNEPYIVTTAATSTVETSTTFVTSVTTTITDTTTFTLFLPKSLAKVTATITGYVTVTAKAPPPVTTTTTVTPAESTKTKYVYSTTSVTVTCLPFTYPPASPPQSFRRREYYDFDFVPRDNMVKRDDSICDLNSLSLIPTATLYTNTVFVTFTASFTSTDLDIETTTSDITVTAPVSTTTVAVGELTTVTPAPETKVKTTKLKAETTTVTYTLTVTKPIKPKKSVITQC